jgi:hypothetical protein
MQPLCEARFLGPQQEANSANEKLKIWSLMFPVYFKPRRVE